MRSCKITLVPIHCTNVSQKIIHFYVRTFLNYLVPSLYFLLISFSPLQHLLTWCSFQVREEGIDFRIQLSKWISACTEYFIVTYLYCSTIYFIMSSLWKLKTKISSFSIAHETRSSSRHKLILLSTNLNSFGKLIATYSNFDKMHFIVVDRYNDWTTFSMPISFSTEGELNKVLFF